MSEAVCVGNAGMNLVGAGRLVRETAMGITIFSNGTSKQSAARQGGRECITLLGTLGGRLL